MTRHFETVSNRVIKKIRLFDMLFSSYRLTASNEYKLIKKQAGMYYGLETGGRCCIRAGQTLHVHSQMVAPATEEEQQQRDEKRYEISF